MDNVRLLLVDDHWIVREGLKMILESSPRYVVVDEASDGDELVTKALALKPDLIVSDLKMPGASVIDSCKVLKEQLPDIKLLILTAFDESEDVFRALEANVDGYIMKDTAPEQILSTMDMVMMGYSCFQSKLQQKKKDRLEISFTDREQEIFELIVENLSNAEIAQQLYISEATVKTHVSSILRKTGQPNRSQAVLYALKKGLVKVPRK
ncbi:DNA-binding response regulator [Brevibacillus reuszeri]|uniref:DNA-binding response regulator n=1 Tax=Brevibacillus reuszeri TaxID=54915 RepID=A0A0K9YJY0_9BACL|nr:response regulator transcription factor [Brevibacillus reuszeri]KNB68957.1 histidine kinase [Brevibacillus reuszeri]MED1859413.1 response regulator transcription factor [Brevibacillus reuszeri]GED71470.1 DNA-binding response regulator [Brevibacillus reuszeri]